MKISCLAFLLTSGALALAASDARASNPASQQESAKPLVSTVPAGKRGVQHSAAKVNHVPTPASAAKMNRSKRPASGQARSATATPRVQPQSRLSQSVVVEKRGSIQNKSVNSVSAVQRQSMFPSSSPCCWGAQVSLYVRSTICAIAVPTLR